MRLQKWVIPVVIALSLLVSGVAWAKGKYQRIEVFFDSISLQINGRLSPMSEDSIMYNGSIYVPLRNVSEVLRAEVGWDARTRAVSLEFLQDNSDLVIGASQDGVYQYVALENNRIMKMLTTHLKANDTKGMRGDIESWGTLRDLSGDIEDEQMASYIEKMMSSAELLRSGWESKQFDQYTLAWSVFKDNATRLNEHIKVKLESDK